MAKVFGVVSPKMSRIIVIPTVAIRTPVSSPQTEIARVVAIAVAATLTRLFPSRIVDKNLSGFSSNFDTLLAPLTLVSTICLSRNLSRDVKAVSELEKKAEKRIQIARSTKYHASTDIFTSPYLKFIRN